MLLHVQPSDPCARQDKNPFAGPAGGESSADQFRANCAVLPWVGRAGRRAGARPPRAQKAHGSSDSEIFHIDGIAGHSNARSNEWRKSAVGMSDGEIWQVIAYLRSVEKNPPWSSGKRRSR